MHLIYITFGRHSMTAENMYMNTTRIEVINYEWVPTALLGRKSFVVCRYWSIMKYEPSYYCLTSVSHFKNCKYQWALPNDRSLYFRAYEFPKLHYGQNSDRNSSWFTLFSINDSFLFCKISRCVLSEYLDEMNVWTKPYREKLVWEISNVFGLIA